MKIENFIKLSKVETAITDKKLVLTGTFNAFSRAELKSICERHWAKVLTSLSNNVDDFLTTENINEIDYYYFFSFKDKDNFIYSFIWNKTK